MHLGKYISLAHGAERRLLDGLVLVDTRYRHNADILQGCELFQGWGRARVRELEQHANRIALLRATDDPERLRSALYHDPRIGGLGFVRDLHDTALLVKEVELAWLALDQAAQALADEELECLCDRSRREIERQMQWVENHIKVASPQALVMDTPVRRTLRASARTWRGPVAFPDALWAPTAAAALVLVVGIAGVLAGFPLLLPSLGPSAYLVAVEAGHPSTRVYNVVTGHLLALAVGFFAVWLCDAAAEPVVLTAGVITWPRAFASCLALFLTIAIALPMRASHPPAAATTLLVTLGSLSQFRQVRALAIGVVLIAFLGFCVRHLRIGSAQR
jgi:hypothetical protein